MAFTSLTLADLQSGKPIKSDIAQQIKTNEDDLNTRLASVEGASNKVEIVNDIVLNAAAYTSSSTFTGLLYYKAQSAFTLTSAVIGQFTAGASSTLEIDLLKATSLNGTFTSVFNTKPSVASNGSAIQIVDYTSLSGDTVTVTINGSANVLTEGVDWTAATSNDATASSLQSAITALTGVTATVLTDTVTVNADNTYQAALTGSDLVNLTISQLTIAGDNTESTNADFGTTAVSQGDYLRIDITSFQIVQNKFLLQIYGEV